LETKIISQKPSGRGTPHWIQRKNKSAGLFPSEEGKRQDQDQRNIGLSARLEKSSLHFVE